MAEASFLEELKRRVLVCDGAMGTELMRRGLKAGECGERWNLERPEEVEGIHRAYRAAGCDLLTTNTFGASEAALARHGLAGEVEAINRKGAELARRALEERSDRRGWVLGDVGPFGGFLEPVGDMKASELLDIFRRQIEALYAGGVDGIIVETMVDPAELVVAVRAAKRVSDRPVIATYAFSGPGEGGEFRTMMGADVSTAVAQARDAGADVVGANCGANLSLMDYLRLAERVRAAAGAVPVIVQPNAGSPQLVEGQLVYPAGPGELADLAGRLVELGVRIVGGCCGTRPEHMRAVVEVVGG